MLFDYIGNIDETVHRQHLNQYINIYLIENIVKTSFIRYFIATTKNLIFTGDFFYFSVHGDRQKNKIYLQCWLESKYFRLARLHQFVQSEAGFELMYCDSGNTIHL